MSESAAKKLDAAYRGVLFTQDGFADIVGAQDWVEFSFDFDGEAAFSIRLTLAEAKDLAAHIGAAAELTALKLKEAR